MAGTAEAGSTVTVRDSETVLGKAQADNSGQWRFATAILAEGAHSFTAIATDAAGNTGAASRALAVTIDTQAPSVALTTVKNDVTGTIVPPSGLTNDNTPTMSGTADPGSTIQVVVSRAKSPDVVLSPTLSGSAWSIAPSTALTDGDYTVTVKAADAAGNVTTVSGGSD